jgi:hypothetical protein
VIFNTQQVINMLGLTSLPEEFTMAQYAQYRQKTAPAVSKELQRKVNKGEVCKVRTSTNTWGAKIHIYRFVRTMSGLV